MYCTCKNLTISFDFSTTSCFVLVVCCWREWAAGQKLEARDQSDKVDSWRDSFTARSQEAEFIEVALGLRSMLS